MKQKKGKSMNKRKFIFWTVVFLSALNFSSPVYAGKKEDAKKQIEVLNQKMKEAGEKGDLQAAIDAAEQALEIASEHFGKESAETAKTMTNAANLYMYAHHAEDAERFYKNVILIESKIYSENDLNLADSFYSLAMAYAVQKKYPEARKMLDKAFKIRAKRLGENHPDTQKIRETIDKIWSEGVSS